MKQLNHLQKLINGKRLFPIKILLRVISIAYAGFHFIDKKNYKICNQLHLFYIDLRNWLHKYGKRLYKRISI